MAHLVFGNHRKSFQFFVVYSTCTVRENAPQSNTVWTTLTLDLTMVLKDIDL